MTPACVTCYLSYDGLGSVRMITDQNGNVIGRHDLMPYGEELFSGYGGRTGNGFGNNDNIAQTFTGQGRDGGTADLDYFNARSMSAVLGRFAQPDPGNAGADIMNPQSWNAYAYVGGNPLNGTDPSGMLQLRFGPDGGDDGLDCYDAEREAPCGGFPSIGYGGDCCYLSGGGGGGRTAGPRPEPNPLPTRHPDPIASASMGSNSGVPGTSATSGETLGLPPGYSVPPPGVGTILGLGGECEFGACSGFSDDQWAGQAGRGAIQYGISSILELLGTRVPYFDLNDPNHRLFGTHYCGPGGGGAATTSIDKACQAHDNCFDRAGLTFGPNVGLGVWTQQQASSAKSCNQAFYNSVKQYPNQPGSQAIQVWLGGYGEAFGILFPGTSVH